MTKRPAAKRPATRPSATYRDGVRGERCRTCHALLRDAEGAPRVAVRVADLEAAALILDRIAERGDLITHFEQAVGRTVAQMKAGGS